MSDLSPDQIIQALKRFGETHAGNAAADYVDDALARLRTPRRPGISGPMPDRALDTTAIARLIDHTQLRPDATEAQIRQLCDEARTYEFASACVHPCYVPLVHKELAESPVAVCTVIGFPHGANRSATKATEVQHALQDGATEIDMVLAIGWLKSGRVEAVEADIRAVVDAARTTTVDTAAGVQHVTVKVILETALLTDAEKAIACVAVHRAGADFVKTSTGFASGGATTRDVALMRQIVGGDLGVKASGGIGSAEAVRRMVAHGATRIGASGGVAIMQGLTAGTDY